MRKAAIILSILTLIVGACGQNNTKQLPPTNEQGQTEIDKRNVINVYLDDHDQLFVNDSLMDITNLRSRIKDFFDIHSEGLEYPEKDFEDIPGLGIIKVNKNAFIAFKNELSTLYMFFVQVLDELHQSFYELRNELSIERFGKTFNNCSEEEQKAVEKVYPLAISEKR